jgi:hypothetical protein
MAQAPELRIRGYLVSPDLFTTGYGKESGPWTCTSQCCGGGAYVDVTERDRVLAHAEMVKRHVDETQTQDESRWFEPNDFADSDYKSGRCVGTTVENGKCILQDKRGFCSLQVAASASGASKWAIKPLYCVLFPLEVIANVIRYDRRFHDVRPCCTAKTEFEIPLFEACKDEVVHLVGEDGYRAMESHYKTHYLSEPVVKDGRLRVV